MIWDELRKEAKRRMQCEPEMYTAQPTQATEDRPCIVTLDAEQQAIFRAKLAQQGDPQPSI